MTLLQMVKVMIIIIIIISTWSVRTIHFEKELNCFKVRNVNDKTALGFICNKEL
jgi:hypothetical protein